MVRHGVLLLLLDILWNGPVSNAFLTAKAGVPFTVVFYLVFHLVLSQYGHTMLGRKFGGVSRIVQLGMRLYTYTFCVGHFFTYPVSCPLKACRAGDATQTICIRILSYLFNFQEYTSVVQMIILMWMLCTCPKLRGLAEWEGECYGSGFAGSLPQGRSLSWSPSSFS